MAEVMHWLIVRGVAIFCLLACCAAAGAQAAPSSIRYSTRLITQSSVHVIDIDMHDQTLLVTPCAAISRRKKLMKFREFQEASQSLAQMTGSFFSLQSGCPIGDIVIRGQQRYFTQRIGAALVVTPRNEPSIIDGPRGAAGWRGYESVLQGGIRLVKAGQISLNPRAQGFHDHYMERCTSRVAVGVLPNAHLLMVQANHLRFPQLAAIMQKLGCIDAMALDGGGSTGFSYLGKSISATSRPLANVLAVVRRSPQEIAARLQPPVLPDLPASASSLAAPTTPRDRPISSTSSFSPIQRLYMLFYAFCEQFR